MVEVAVVGASGYGGGELLRLLARHPAARVVCAVSETYAGRPLTGAFPGLRGTGDLKFESYDDGSRVAQCEVVFLAQENTKAMHTVPHLREAGCKVVDLSADFRFHDLDTYAKWYGVPHNAPYWVTQSVYGLPELYKENIRETSLVGNPGCHATAGILALAPLVRHGLVRPDSIIIDSKTGVSGAGRAKFGPDTHFAEINESVSAYKIGGAHRHTPEIEMVLHQQLNAGQGDWRDAGLEVAGSKIAQEGAFAVTFTPHLVPITRGILATCYATLGEAKELRELADLYTRFYADAPFVAVVEDGLPTTKHTQGTNFCLLALAVDARLNRVTIISCLDNLVKGAAGQAIQNMNLMCGFSETAGLDLGGMWP